MHKNPPKNERLCYKLLTNERIWYKLLTNERLWYKLLTNEMLWCKLLTGENVFGNCINIYEFALRFLVRTFNECSVEAQVSLSKPVHAT